MATLADLANRMQALTVRLKSEANRCAIETASAIVGNLVFKTPVDTSTALSNWDTDLNSPAQEGFHDAWVMGIAGSTRSQSANFAINYSNSILKDRKFGEPIFISNSTPYIMDLEYGTSVQAPNGFVQQAMVVGRQTIREFKMRL